MRRLDSSAPLVEMASQPSTVPAEAPAGMIADHPSVAWFHGFQRIRAKRLEPERRAEAVVVAIDNHHGRSDALLRARTLVQAALKKPTRRDVFEELLEMKEPFTARSLGSRPSWKMKSARYWLEEFVRLGLLRVTPRGHYWAIDPRSVE